MMRPVEVIVVPLRHKRTCRPLSQVTEHVTKHCAFREPDGISCLNRAARHDDISHLIGIESMATDEEIDRDVDLSGDSLNGSGDQIRSIR